MLHIGGGAFFVRKYCCVRKRRESKIRVTVQFDKLDGKTLLAELAEKPGFLDGKLLFQILCHTNKYINDKLTDVVRILISL